MTLAMKLRETLEEGKAQGFSEGKALGLSEGKALGLSEGKALGLSEGKTQGEILKLISQIRKKHMKKISAEETADMLEENVIIIMAVMDFFDKNPDISDEDVYQKLYVQIQKSNEQ